MSDPPPGDVELLRKTLGGWGGKGPLFPYGNQKKREIMDFCIKNYRNGPEPDNDSDSDSKE